MTSEQVWGLQQLNKNLWEKHSKQKNNKYKVPREEAPCVCVCVCVCVCLCVCVSVSVSVSLLSFCLSPNPSGHF